MEKRKLNALISLIMNSVLILMEIVVVTFAFTVPNFKGDVQGFTAFRYFTIDSNVLCGIVAILLVEYDSLILKGRKDRLPKYAVLLKFVVTVMITITFLTVICWLAPVQGFDRMYGGISSCTHLLAPLVTMISFFCFEYERDDTNLFIESLWGMIPVTIYAVIYLIMVVVIGNDNGGWDDFYNFNNGGFWYLALIIMLVASYLFSLGVLYLHRLIGKKLAPKEIVE